MSTKSGIPTTLVEELDLSVRTYNALKREVFCTTDTIEGVASLLDADLFEIRYFHQAQMDELVEKLTLWASAHGPIAHLEPPASTWEGSTARCLGCLVNAAAEEMS